jgi:hypothetical protein
VAVVVGDSTDTPSTDTESDAEIPCEAHLSGGGFEVDSFSKTNRKN